MVVASSLAVSELDHVVFTDNNGLLMMTLLTGTSINHWTWFIVGTGQT